MAEYDINGKDTKVGDTVCFTDPWHGKHEATITQLEPKNGSHHATLEMSKDAIKDLGEWFSFGIFHDVPHHKEGVPYSWDHKE